MSFQRKQCLVIGLGRFGSAVATTLYEMGHEVVGIDKNEENVEQVMNQVTHAAIVDSTKEKALRSLGVADFDAVIVAIGSDSQANILTTMNAKSLGARHVVSKANDNMTQRVLERIGADVVIRPEHDMGVRLARQIASPNVLDTLDLGANHAIEEIEATSTLFGSLLELNLTGRFNVQVIAINHANKLIFPPKAEDRISAKDLLVVMGHQRDLQRLRDFVQEP